MTWFAFDFQSFALSFLSILFEGIPFVLLGALISGVVEAFVPARLITRMLPRNGAAAICASGLLGLVLPMCECGSVVVIRRFIRKGVPVSCAITYMLAAPIVSPIVLLSTLAAFKGQDPWTMTALRLSLGYLLAIGVGFAFAKIPLRKLLRPGVAAPVHDHDHDHDHDHEHDHSHAHAHPTGLRTKLALATRSAAADFLDVAFFLVIGAALASVFNTAIRQDVISPLAASPALATAAMMGLAFVIALCSSSDAFIAATFVQFPFVAKLAFLVFGPMFDIKLIFLYGLILRRRWVFGLGIGLALAVWLICVRLSSIIQ